MQDAYGGGGQQYDHEQYYQHQGQHHHHHHIYNSGGSPNAPLTPITPPHPALLSPQWTKSISNSSTPLAVELQQVQQLHPHHYQPTQLQEHHPALDLDQQQSAAIDQQNLHEQLQQQLQLEPSPARTPTKNKRQSTAGQKSGNSKELAASTANSREQSLRKGSTDGRLTGTKAAAGGVARRAKSMASVDDGNRPKRVRTGCLTCRERHLKCDEGLPECLNCRKSNRVCKRGVRLNFIDTTVKDPPVTVPIAQPWRVEFQDESREIASDYDGGYEKYAALHTPSPRTKIQSPPTPMSVPPKNNSISPPSSNTLLHQPLPPIQAHITAGHVPDVSGVTDEGSRRNSRMHSITSQASFIGGGHNEVAMQPEPDVRSLLNKPEETLFMQVFVEEVGAWMDTVYPYKHFSRLLPFHALGEPMLLNAFLACGARHLSLVNPAYKEDRALHYYDTATRLLLASLQNPNRDIVISATTSVILNVYEIMSERALQRMNHIAGARALIKECGWSARTTGVGGACFWINVTMELLSCLHFNWTIAWNPDDWGVNMDFSQDCEAGHEELWAHRMIYLLAKVANFRSSIPRYSEGTDYNYINAKNQERYEEWKYLKDQCDAWNRNVPRNMHPMAYLYPHQTDSKSVFPEVWLLKRVVIVARLFYHTAMILLAQINPYVQRELKEMGELAALHSQTICGIIAPMKDRTVAAVALRSLAIAAECLTERAEQDEVLDILRRIKKETGWRVDFLFPELKSKWGWPPEPQPQNTQAPPTSLLTTTLLNHNPANVAPATSYASQPPVQNLQPDLNGAPRAPPLHPPRRYPMQNPLQSATALDFTTQAHPYYPHYVSAPPPQQQHNDRHSFF